MSDQATLQQTFDAALAELKGKQRKFVVEYLQDMHGQNAAIRAGYSEATARSQASRLLTFVNIQAAIQAGMALYAMSAAEALYRLTDHARGDMSDFVRVDEEEITLTWSLLNVSTTDDGEVDLAGAMIRLASQEHVQPTDRILHTATITRAAARLDLLEAGRRGKLHLIKKYSRDDKGKETIELYDAQAASVQIGKAHSLFVERQEITGKNGQPIAIVSAEDLAAARQRAQQWEAEHGRGEES
jgi:phage terminase small subunit